MGNKRSSSHGINLLVTVLVWFVLIVIHSFAIAIESNGAIPFFWHAPSLYVSTWILDLLLIGVWYLNYYLLAPQFIARQHYVAYSVVVLLFMVLGLCFTPMLYYAFGLPMPLKQGPVGVSWYGFGAMLILFALSFATRSFTKWIALQREVNNLKQERKDLLEKIAQLEGEKEEVEVATVETISPEELTRQVEAMQREEEIEPL